MRFSRRIFLCLFCGSRFRFFVYFVRMRPSLITYLFALFHTLLFDYFTFGACYTCARCVRRRYFYLFIQCENKQRKIYAYPQSLAQTHSTNILRRCRLDRNRILCTREFTIYIFSSLFLCCSEMASSLSPQPPTFYRT